jgi:uncharacterized protein GlcG (DUF336 family)
MLTLAQSRTIVDGALDYARAQGLQPLAVAVLDARAVLKSFHAEDGTSVARGDIAIGKANAALALGTGSRSLAKAAREVPHFIQSLSSVVRGGIVPHVGGVLIRSPEGDVLGAVGISGDRGDRDEAAALAGIEQAGLTGDPERTERSTTVRQPPCQRQGYRQPA